MINEKLETLQKELKSVLIKETELENSLLEVKELKLKYMGAIEVLKQLNEESDNDKVEE
tara:strand:- start:1610 stop:1786 length:177 start_codon:yes stop_codon:yes gene_type:complete